MYIKICMCVYACTFVCVHIVKIVMSLNERMCANKTNLNGKEQTIANISH